MKKFVQLLIVILAVVVITGCQKPEDVPALAKGQAAQEIDLQVSVTEFNAENYQAMAAANQSRLKALGLNSTRDCMGQIDVPADYLTIQEAVDAACNSAQITVAAGIYDEIVYISKPGLKITADGDATLNGGFYLDELADETHIDGFTINIDSDFGTNKGIEVYYADYLTIMNCNISGIGWGMLLWNMSHSKIENNVVQNGYWGILIASFEDYKSDFNKVANNTVTGVMQSSGIGLQGDCDYNAIHNNTVTDCPMGSNAGIFFYSYSDEKACNNNSVKGNNSSRNGGNAAYGGFGMGPIYGNENSIGPFNTFNENNKAGITVSTGTYGNDFIKNEILNNVVCDIRDLSGGMNNYNKNTYDCFSDGSE